MDTKSPMLPAGTQSVRTLADVLSVIATHPGADGGRRRQGMTSAVRAICRVLGNDPATVPAAPAALRACLDEVSWPATGLSASYISGVRSLTLSALALAGVPVIRSRSRITLSPAWGELRARVQDQAIWSPLSRLAAYCTEQAIAPSDVTGEVLDRFEAVLKEQSIKSDPGHRSRTMRWAWSKAAPLVGADAPGIRVSKPSRRYALEWEAFPESLIQDAEAFLTSRMKPNPFARDYSKPVTASTTAMRRKQIRQLASALVASGFPLAELTALSVLTVKKNAEDALAYLYERAGSKQTAYLGQQAQLLATLAKRWTGAPVETVKRLSELVSNVGIGRPGMVEKNRRRLAQFDDEANAIRLAILPVKTFSQLSRKGTLSSSDVARGVYALATELLLHVPIRVGNLCALDLATHIWRSARGSSEIARLDLPKTKNGDPYSAMLHAETLGLLDAYLAFVRPAITTHESTWLFPNPKGGLRHPIAFSRGIESFIARETGLNVNPHLFRHLAVFLHNRANPGDRETPRQLLGHRSSATTERSYTLMDSAAAATRHDQMIAMLRSQATPTQGSTAKKNGVA